MVSNRTATVRILFLAAITLAYGCAPADNVPRDDRAAALKAALDTTARAWKHETGADSVTMHGDTATVWVTPRHWQATDPPAAIVRVMPGGRLVGIQWIMGG
jgi:hypothetical protein